MANGNARVRERFELSLDGGQIATIVVGALVTVSAVFVLGLKMGQHLAVRQAERPAVDLSALDRPPATDVAAPAAPPLRYAEALLNKRPAPPPPLQPRPGSAAPGASAAPPAAQPSPSPGTSATPAAEQHPAVPADPVVLAAPSSAPPAASAAVVAAGTGFTVQLASATSREDANRAAARVSSHGPRVVEADVPGKGHFFRVRVGRFDSKDAAERFRDDLSRETGLKGVVMRE